MKQLNKNLLLTFFFMILALVSCKKEEALSDIDLLRNGNNEDVYPTTK